MKSLILGVSILGLCAFAQTGQSTGTQTTTQTTTTTTQEHTRTEKGVHSKNWKGMLVDANCGAAAGETAERSQTGAGVETESNRASETSSSANRSEQETTMGHSSKAQWQSCPATASTTQFGLLLSDGRMVHFDPAGNQKAEQGMQSNSKWTKAANSGKPAKVKVRGTLFGDTLEVHSIK